MTTYTKRTTDALRDAGYSVTSAPAPLLAIVAYAAQNPGLDFRNYGDVTAYRGDARRIARDWRRVRDGVMMCAAHHVTDADFDSGGGRMTLTREGEGFRVDYCTGQYWPTEYRAAAASAIDGAVQSAADRERAVTPRAEIDATGRARVPMSEIRALAESVGSHWFDRDSMRFFNSRIVGAAARVTADGATAYFVSSECSPSGVRAFTVRRAALQGEHSGDVRTVGEFQGYRTAQDAADAIAALLRAGAGVQS